MMEKEIETRFLDIDKNELVKKLVSLNAMDKGEEKLQEIIFYDKARSWQGKHKFVRLRKIKDKIKLTYKSNTLQTVDSAREIELEVSDLEKCSELFDHIGLKAVREMEKYRHTFKLGDVSVDIGTWPKIPTYMEVEGPSVESLKNVCSLLGIDWEKRFDGDAREVFKRYGHNIDDFTMITFAEFK